MKRLPLLSLALFLSLAACRSTDEGAAPVEAENATWIVLFDGTSLDAWRGYKSDTVPAGWEIRDGALTRVAGGGDLMTRDQYASFDLRFEWRVSPGANSGVIWHVSEDKNASYETGPEYQVLDNATLGESGDLRTAAGSNYALHAPPSDYTKAPGEWNEGRIEVDGAHVRHWLNGELVVDYELWTDEWKALVKASKFDQMPDYGLRKRGHIVLQEHGAEVAYRNVRIRVL